MAKRIRTAKQAWLIRRGINAARWVSELGPHSGRWVELRTMHQLTFDAYLRELHSGFGRFVGSK